jgi:hypothetical protein
LGETVTRGIENLWSGKGRENEKDAPSNHDWLRDSEEKQRSLLGVAEELLAGLSAKFQKNEGVVSKDASCRAIQASVTKLREEIDGAESKMVVSGRSWIGGVLCHRIIVEAIN